MEIKSSLIEPIFISIAEHNATMGDWIINEFIKNKHYQHAALVGKLVLCDRSRLIDRLRIMLDKTVETLLLASNNTGLLT